MIEDYPFDKIAELPPYKGCENCFFNIGSVCRHIDMNKDRDSFKLGEKYAYTLGRAPCDLKFWHKRMPKKTLKQRFVYWLIKWVESK